MEATMKQYAKNYAKIADPIEREIEMTKDHLVHLNSLLETLKEPSQALDLREAIHEATIDLMYLGYFPE
jgi:ferritin-like metal-binding protein YciE